MTEINFKDLSIPAPFGSKLALQAAYFTWDGTHYQKMSKTKVRKFGTSIERIIRSNPVVTYWGQDINALLSGMNNI